MTDSADSQRPLPLLISGLVFVLGRGPCHFLRPLVTTQVTHRPWVDGDRWPAICQSCSDVVACRSPTDILNDVRGGSGRVIGPILSCRACRRSNRVMLGVSLQLVFSRLTSNRLGHTVLFDVVPHWQLGHSENAALR